MLKSILITAISLTVFSIYPDNEKSISNQNKKTGLIDSRENKENLIIETQNEITIRKKQEENQSQWFDIHTEGTPNIVLDYGD